MRAVWGRRGEGGHTAPARTRLSVDRVQSRPRRKTRRRVTRRETESPRSRCVCRPRRASDHLSPIGSDRGRGSAHRPPSYRVLSVNTGSPPRRRPTPGSASTREYCTLLRSYLQKLANGAARDRTVPCGRTIGRILVLLSRARTVLFTQRGRGGIYIWICTLSSYPDSKLSVQRPHKSQFPHEFPIPLVACATRVEKRIC